jgi:hypothetical protein
MVWKLKRLASEGIFHEHLAILYSTILIITGFGINFFLMHRVTSIPDYKLLGVKDE